ncbi:hypothetical protein ACQ86N_02450 [Puia sp. P3]|uniref:hypothetical protein n=1 Tax=Puia sp. P3 TaxID=3423952 RepID=UPI003D67296C
MENPEEKKRLMESLQRGNRQTVTLNLQGQERKIATEAAPQFKSLNYYDEHGKRLQLQSILQTPQQAFGEQSAQQNTSNNQTAGKTGETNLKNAAGSPAQQAKPLGQSKSPEAADDGKESKALKNSPMQQGALRSGQKEKQKKTKRLQP